MVSQLRFLYLAAVIALSAAGSLGSAEERMNNGQRSEQTSGGSADLQGDTNLGRNGVNRTEDIRRTATGNLQLSESRLDRIRQLAAKLKLQGKNDVSFTISVGAAVPRQAVAQELPRELAAELPTSTPLKYVLFRAQLVLVDQKTDRIVAVIPGIK